MNDQLKQGTIWSMWFDNYTDPVSIVAPADIDLATLVSIGRIAQYEALIEGLSDVQPDDPDAEMAAHMRESFRERAAEVQARLIERGPTIWLAEELGSVFA